MPICKQRKEYAFELLFKYLWFILILPKPLQLFFLGSYAFVLLYQRNFKLDCDHFAIFVYLYIAIHFISVIVHIPCVSDITRILAAGNTIAIWFISVLLYSLYLSFPTNLDAIERYCFIDCLVLFVLFCVYRILVLTGIENFRMPILGHYLVVMEDVGFKNLRFIGFLDYANLIVAFCITIVPFAWHYVHKHLIKRFNECGGLVALLFYVIMFLPVYYCYSRVGYLLYLLGFVAIMLFTLKKKLTPHYYKLIALIIFILVLLASIIFRQFFVDIIRNLWNLRRGSNHSRKMIYTQTIQEWMSSPIFGKGIKVIGKSGYPLGSHSTYLGFLYKTGILGFIIISTAFINKTVLIIKSLFSGNLFSQIVSSFFILFLFFLAFEDLDGSDWLICLFFVNLGIYSNQNNFPT